jgi:hypothetical protein
LTVNLACIDPAIVSQVWPHVSHLIRRAMKRGDMGLFGPVEMDVLAGRALLWIATDGTAIEAAAVTQLERTETRKVCTIVACGGAHMRQWLHLIEGIEKFARAEGCNATRIIGRKGWQRMLKDYRATRVILEKAL